MAETVALQSVMVVDDQPSFRTVARRVVSLMTGWELVAEAESGEAAVRLASENQPDIILMDINLPGISGIEATTEILTERPGTRVVLASTYAPVDLPPEAATCGAVGYIRKEELTLGGLRAAAEGRTPWSAVG